MIAWNAGPQGCFLPPLPEFIFFQSAWKVLISWLVYGPISPQQLLWRAGALPAWSCTGPVVPSLAWHAYQALGMCCRGWELGKAQASRVAAALTLLFHHFLGSD